MDLTNNALRPRKGIEDFAMGFWESYKRFPVIYKILIGFILGIIAGIVVGPSIAAIRPLGELLIRLLKMIVAPIVLFSLVVGAASIAPSKLGKIGVKIIIYYLFTSAVAVIIGIFMARIFSVGTGIALGGVHKQITVKSPPPVVNVLLNIIPTNPFAALTEGKVLQIIFFAIVLGIALTYLMNSKNERLRKAGEVTYRVFDGLAEAMYKIVRGILEYMPIAVVALYVGLFIHIFVTYGDFLAAFRLNIIKFLRGAKEAMLTAFVTRSSSGTLPVTMRVAEENLGIKRTVFAFTLPPGATINMDGTAMYQAIATFFIANALGIHLTLGQQLLIVLATVLASIGTAGVPSAGLIMLTMVLQSVGLPLTNPNVALAYSMIAGIDAS